MLSANHSSWKGAFSKPSEWLAFCVPCLVLLPQQSTEFNAPVRFHVKLCAKCAITAAARSICPSCFDRELLRVSPCEFLTTQHSFSVSFWMFIGLLWALYYTTRRLKRVSKTTEAVNHVCWCPSQDSDPISLPCKSQAITPVTTHSVNWILFIVIKFSACLVTGQSPYENWSRTARFRITLRNMLSFRCPRRW